MDPLLYADCVVTDERVCATGEVREEFQIGTTENVWRDAAEVDRMSTPDTRGCVVASVV